MSSEIRDTIETVAAGSAELALALARRHAAMEQGARFRVSLGGRDVTVELARLLLRGAGFERIRVTPDTRGLIATATRARTLPDWIGPARRLLICGLNPSLYSADSGMPFGRPGNRFWPALLGAGVVERERDLEHAYARGVGFTDLVKRATPASAEITAREYAHGARRLRDLVEIFQPRVVCFVGLEGWRQAIDKRAAVGWVPDGFAAARAYLMPSTSGRNANASLADLVGHLRRAID